MGSLKTDNQVFPQDSAKEKPGVPREFWRFPRAGRDRAQAGPIGSGDPATALDFRKTQNPSGNPLSFFALFFR